MSNHISIPDDLREQIEDLARSRGISVDEFVRQSLKECVDSSRQRDSVFVDGAVFQGDAPTDGAAKHDDYLYGDAS